MRGKNIPTDQEMDLDQCKSMIEDELVILDVSPPSSIHLASSILLTRSSE